MTRPDAQISAEPGTLWSANPGSLFRKQVDGTAFIPLQKVTTGSFTEWKVLDSSGVRYLFLHHDTCFPLCV